MPTPRPLAAAALAATAAVASPAAGTSVVFDTSLGSFEVDLFEDRTPGTVANFLAYADAGDYDDTIFHRAAEGADGSEFVIQGGNFRFDGEPVSSPFELEVVEGRGTIENEPGISNLRGTLALARVSGQEDSGSNQFFFNLGDNLFLDDVDGGFTVFGEVADGRGLSVIDAIAGVPTFAGDAPFGEIPLRGFEGGEELGADNFVLVNSVVRVEIEEVPGVDPDTPGGDEGDGGEDGGGDTPTAGDPAAVPTPGAAVAGLFGLGACVLRRRRG